jgi:hypothetical protein
MGWGVEFLWLTLHDRGLRLGIVDAVSVTHLFWPGATYGRAREVERLERLVAEHGLASFDELQKVVQTLGFWELG